MLQRLQAKAPLPKLPPVPALPPPPPLPSPPPPSSTAVGRVLSLLRQCVTVAAVKRVHAHMLAASIRKENSLLFRLVELGDRDYAAACFRGIPSPDSFAYNVMIRGLATSWADHPAALELHLLMLRSGLRPDNYTYPFVLAATASLRWRRHGEAVQSLAFKSGHHSESHTQHSLMSMYSRCGDMASARRVFDELSTRDLVSWNSLISGYSKMGFPGEAVEIFRRMRLAGFEPDDMTLVSVVAACGDLGDLSLGRWLEELAAGKGADLDSFVGCAFVSMYGKCGDLDSARRVFDQMTNRHVVAWNAMISGQVYFDEATPFSCLVESTICKYSQNGLSDEAIALFKSMQEASVEPNEVTIVTVLSACAAVGALDMGEWVDAYASQRGLLTDVYVGTALMDMYAKCGNLGRAIQIFEAMPQKNEVSWNAMISAFAFNGQAQEALSLFGRMRDEKTVQPNDITFVGVLSACVHAGLLDEGRRWFKSMHQAFGIVPQIEHYSCMVDLLARAGCLEEAWEFIEAMPEKPDAVVLGALLAACRISKNVEIGDRVIHRLLELEPGNSGNYVISSKLYAGSKRWEESARIRGLMRERGVTKTPGCSWIQICSEVHEFRSGDALHSRSAEVYQIIDVLKHEMRIEGYIPNINLV
ncbi:hypothetical protein Taro_021706 [Colocasia esculenta]|uniref:Pentatricopeptide repeat-containing protein n=1 Tax=Colocasia esculenta TaxID=4460 RepID=A0A843UZN1_COLES|nr:hypothetical protein [Colocasia esculenta]